MSETYDLISVEAVRAIIGEPNPAVPLKLMEALDEMSMAYIRKSPFLLLATADPEGWPDVSPKGDEPGFVAIENANTLLIPERKGNRMMMSLRNVLSNPRVAVIFLVPGTEETLRLEGRASLTSEPEVLERLSARGQPALLAIRVEVGKCFFHCAKAFKRSRLWKPESWPARQRVSFGTQLAPKLGGGADMAKQIDEMIEADYKENL